MSTVARGAKGARGGRGTRGTGEPGGSQVRPAQFPGWRARPGAAYEGLCLFLPGTSTRWEFLQFPLGSRDTGSARSDIGVGPGSGEPRETLVSQCS